MSFANGSYFIVIVLAIIAFVSIMYLYHARYFRWIKKYWNYQSSWWSKLSLVFYFISFSLLIFSLLDIRGPEEKIKTSIPDQKTIIILDSSASMLAEDIRPNRFGKAIQMARHFVKNAPGHQISVVLFSDVQKRLIPFTDDIDLLDSRLAALEKTNAVGGGSNISQAIKEAVGYFLLGGENADPVGNILVFTDAEESEGSLDVELGSKINLAVVGIGTAKGSTIPLRWDDGTFRGYKNSGGENVITKLDEEYIKKLGKNAKNYKYWIANSYALPTEEIKSFFRSSFSLNNAQGDISIRPVLSQKIVIPAIILYCLGVVFSRFKTFKIIVSFSAVMLFGLAEVGMANEKAKEKEIPDGLKKELVRMKNGELDKSEILKIAENFLKNDDPDRALAIYNDYSNKRDDVEVVFNRATAFLQKGDFKKASPLIQEILLSSASEEVKDQIRSNVLLSIKKEQEKQENQKQDEQNKQENGQGQGDDQKDQDGEDDSKEKNNNEKSGSGKDKKQDDKQDKKDKNDKKDEDKSDEPKDLERPEENEGPQTIEEKEKQIEQQRKMVKTPAMIRQILNDDRELQKKMMDTSTNEKGASRPKRDW